MDAMPHRTPQSDDVRRRKDERSDARVASDRRSSRGLRRARLFAVGAVLAAGCGGAYAMEEPPTGADRGSVRSNVPAYGVRLRARLDFEDLVARRLSALSGEVRGLLKEDDVALVGGVERFQKGLRLRVADARGRARLAGRLRALTQTGEGAVFAMSESGGDALVLRVTPAGLEALRSNGLARAAATLRRRAELSGVGDARVSATPNGRIAIDLPGSRDAREAKRLFASGGLLQFRWVADARSMGAPSEKLPMRGAGAPVDVETQVQIDGSFLADAQSGADPWSAEPMVSIRFDERGAALFNRVTAANVGRFLAIVIDGRVASSPRVMSPMTDGRAQITGALTWEEARALAATLRGGALPAKLFILEASAYDASGAASAQAPKVKD
jgi:preprotein translocase subunit SecD